MSIPYAETCGLAALSVLIKTFQVDIKKGRRTPEEVIAVLESVAEEHEAVAPRTTSDMNKHVAEILHESAASFRRLAAAKEP